MSSPFKTHGPNAKQLNILFACLFGFPLVMGGLLALGSGDTSIDITRFFERRAALPAADAPPEPPVPFQEMLDRSFGAAQQVLATLNAKLPRFDASTPAELTPSDYEELASGALGAGADDDLVTGSIGDYVQGTESPVFAPALPVGYELSGKPQVRDAIILSFGNSRMKLVGLDAPAQGAQCRLLSNALSDCRQAASEQLSFFLSWRNVTCQVTGADEDGMPFGQCRLGGSDIGEWLVRRGWASPVDMADPAYRAAALFAQSYKLGQYRPY